MSTTLTNGLKLPDKGSVDWYADMQNNYAILDGAVGTIAEHTSALSGKAPLVHTHTKSDVTDLFNSANEWTDLQSYTQSIKFKVNLTVGAAPSSDVYGGFNFGNAGTNLGNVTARVSSAGATYSRLYIGNKFANEALDPNGTWKYTELQVGLRANGDKYLYTDGSWRNNLLPLSNNTYDLGSSSYQWNNLYAKNYYYNGTEFQNKFVTLDTEQLITGLKRLKTGWWRLQAANLKVGAGESYGRNGYTLVWTDKDDVTICDIAPYKQSQAAKTYLRIRGGDYYTNGVPDAAGTLVQGELRIGTLANSSRMIECYTNAMYPGDNNTADLGTSTKRWKTLNGINPGALSLPNLNYSDSNKWIDLSGNITDETGGDNEYDPAVDGWVVIRANNNPTFLRINVHAPRPSARKYVASATGVAAPDGTMVVSVPAPAGSRVYIFFNKGSGSLDSATFITCQGNV